MATKTWTQTSDNLWSTDANWSGGTKPVAGDNIVFDATSTANCTMDQIFTAGSFTIAAGYAAGIITQSSALTCISYTQAGGVFNQGADVVVNDTTTLSGGTLTGSTSYTWTTTDNFVHSAGTLTPSVLRLTMTGISKAMTPKTGDIFRALTVTGSITINANCRLQNFANSGTITIATGVSVIEDYRTGYTWSNSGIIQAAGTGAWSANLMNSDWTVSFGQIDCPAHLYLNDDATASRVIYVSGSASFGGSLLIDSNHATNTITLDLSASNYALTAAGITIGTRGIINGRASIITCNGTFDSSAGTFTKGTSTLIMGATGNLKCASGGVYNLRVAEAITTTLTAALNVYKDLRIIGTLTRGANTVSLLGAGEQTVSGYPDTAITVNSTGPVIFLDCLHHVADTTFIAGTCVWVGDLPQSYVVRGNLSMSAISRKPHAFSNVQNISGTLTFDEETRMKNLTTDAGCTTVQLANVRIGIYGKIATVGTFTKNTPAMIFRSWKAPQIPFPKVLVAVNQAKGYGDI